MFDSYLKRKNEEYGNKFDSSDLNKIFIPFFNNHKRVTVQFCNDKGKVYETKRGTIGVTTGWKPIFLLMLTSRSIGSSWVINKNCKIIQ